MALIDDLLTLAVAYNVSLTDAQIDLYTEALADLDPADVHLGVVEVIKTSKWMPKIAEIRAATATALLKKDVDEVEAWHAARLQARSELPMSVKIYNMPPETAIVIDWRHCVVCGTNYSAEWGECPGCSLEAL